MYPMAIPVYSLPIPVKEPLLMVIGDGKCAIDVVHGSKGISDLATYEDIWKAAVQVLERCVDPPRTEGQGGFVGGVGMYSRDVFNALIPQRDHHLTQNRRRRQPNCDRSQIRARCTMWTPIAISDPKNSL